MRRLQHVREVRGAARPGAPPVRLRGGGDGPLRARGSSATDGRARLLGLGTTTRTRPTSCTACAQDQLEHARFPLGELTKPEVRAVARSLGLATADKPESQEICFVPGGDYRDALRERAGWQPEAGPLLDADGRAGRGARAGPPATPSGQRQGLGVALGEPRYVSRIDPRSNTIQLGRREDLETRDVHDRARVVRRAATARGAVPGRRPHPPPRDARSRPRVAAARATRRWAVDDRCAGVGRGARPGRGAVRRRRGARRRPDRAPGARSQHETGRAGRAGRRSATAREPRAVARPVRPRRHLPCRALRAHPRLCRWSAAVARRRRDPRRVGR